jgi:hypothetical protein
MPRDIWEKQFPADIFNPHANSNLSLALTAVSLLIPKTNCAFYIPDRLLRELMKGQELEASGLKLCLKERSI